MAQHFLLSAAARSLSPAKVMRMSDRGAENVFLRLRWPRQTASRSARIAPARSAMIAAARPVRPAGAAKPAAPISQ